MTVRTAELINLVYFSALSLLALVWPLETRSRKKAVAIGAGALLLTVFSTAAAPIIRDWLPAPVIAFAYWISGCFYQKPNARLQALFDRSERAILTVGLLHKVARTWWGGALEVAYVFCYPVVPLGLAALYFLHLSDKADTYWTVVLLSAYPCYALLPFVQLRPPRLVERTDEVKQPARQFRRFNLWLVRHVTHEANTFPSGHVAASTAIALVLANFALWAGIVFSLIALGIAAGCIVGRYHYAVDVAAAFFLASSVSYFVLS